jgi:hypothetical protein
MSARLVSSLASQSLNFNGTCFQPFCAKATIDITIDKRAKSKQNDQQGWKTSASNLKQSFQPFCAKVTISDRHRQVFCIAY